MTESASYLFEKAEQCRRLASTILNHNDPTRTALLALAYEYKARAKAAMTRAQVADSPANQGRT